MLAILLNGVTR